MEQRTKNIRLILSLTVLLALIVVVWGWQTRTTTVVDKTIFQVSDLTTIDHVTLLHGTDTVNLTTTGARWQVNGQLADRNMIDVLFATLQQAEPRRPVAASLRDSLGARMEAEGVRVTLLAGDTRVKEFIAYGNAARTQAYFKYPGDPAVYQMIIPGYRVYVSGIFELGANGWLDKYVFNFNWRNFQDLTVTYRDKPAEGFDVKFVNRFFTIPDVAKVDTTRLNNFLDAVSLITVDTYPDEVEPRIDSLLATPAVATITARDVGGKAYTLELYAPLPGQAEAVGRIGGRGVALFSLPKVRELLRPRGYFISK